MHGWRINSRIQFYRKSGSGAGCKYANETRREEGGRRVAGGGGGDETGSDPEILTIVVPQWWVGEWGGRWEAEEGRKW